MTALKRIDLIKRKFNESAFRKKVAPKLMSILFAVIFWLYVMDQVNPEMIRSFPNVPVEVLNIEMIEDRGFKVLETTDHVVTVKVKGRRKSVMAMNVDDLALSIDLKNFKKGSNQFPIDRKLFTDSVIIESISENRITLTIDQVVSVTKPVEIKTVGVLPEGMSMDALKLSPEVVTVTGPESIVANVVKAVGELDVSQLKDSISANLMITPVSNAQEEVRGVSLSQNNILCTFGILKTQSVGIVPQLVGTLPNNLVLSSIKVSPESVQIKGDADVLATIGEIKTQSIDLSRLNQSTEIEVSFDLPDHLKKTLSIETAKVILTLDEVDLKELDYLPAEVVLKNVPKGFRIEMVDLSDMLKVRVRGSKSVLSSLEKNDIRLVLECSGLKEGIERVKVEFEHQMVQGTGLTVEPEWVDVIVSKVSQ